MRRDSYKSLIHLHFLIFLWGFTSIFGALIDLNPIFIVWLINISGFFGILSDQKEFFLSSSPYVLTMTLFLLVINNSTDKKYLIKLFLIFLLGLTVEIIGVNFSIFFGDYQYGDNLGLSLIHI